MKPRRVRPARSRRLAASLFVVVLLATGAALAAWEGLGLVPAHDVRRAVAQPDATLSTRADQETASAAATVPALLDATLRVTDGALHFGLNHRTTLRFTSVEREGNCVEYAQLFATLFNRAARAKGVAARAWPVRSQARFFGARVAMRGWTDHDWVLIEDAGGRRWYVDPTLHDAGLGWDVSSNVQGVVRTRAE